MEGKKSTDVAVGTRANQQSLKGINVTKCGIVFFCLYSVPTLISLAFYTG